MSSDRTRAVFQAAAVASLLVAPIPADGGGVGGSPHDLVVQGYDAFKESAEKSACIPCHLPVIEGEENFLRTVPPVLRQYDSASLQCFSCHDGTTIVTSNVDASTTAFHPLSHGYDLEERREDAVDEKDLRETEGKKMSCMACHDPHDNGNRPFLRKPLGELCQSCHAAESPDEEESLPGTHPVLREFPEGGNVYAPISIHEAFRTPFPKTYPLGGGKSADGVHWDLGGHLEWGDEGRLTCATCHVVHGDEVEPPSSMFLPLDPVRESADEFCEGCHRGQRGDGQSSPPWPNPGGTITARTYHPCDDDIGNGTERLVETLDPEGWPFGSAASKPLICTTCHSPHGAAKGTMLLRPSPGGTGFCEACHDQTRLKNHHPVAGLQGNCFSALSKGPAVEGGGRMLCDSCHRAHNAGLDREGEEEDQKEQEALYTPILREPWDAVEICATCHPLDNPTCSTDPLYLASHFIGDPTLSETYDDSDPPLRTAAWPQSGLHSIYGGRSGKAVTCLSCHTFKEKGVVSGDDGDAAHLLAESGNMVEWDEGGGDSYLCIGCHSTNPTDAGSSHPYMDADAGNLDVEPEPPASITPNGHVNCDSCHRSHEAQTSSGRYMLEAVQSENGDPLKIHPKIDFKVLCYTCHDSTKY